MTTQKTTGQAAGRQPLTHAQVVEIAGQVDDIMAARIIATGATAEDLEEAVAWAAGESDVMGLERKRANTVVHSLYNILTAERKFPDDRD
jgi:hypothetical protein